MRRRALAGGGPTRTRGAAHRGAPAAGGGGAAGSRRRLSVICGHGLLGGIVLGPGTERCCGLRVPRPRACGWGRHTGHLRHGDRRPEAPALEALRLRGAHAPPHRGRRLGAARWRGPPLRPAAPLLLLCMRHGHRHGARRGLDCTGASGDGLLRHGLARVSARQAVVGAPLASGRQACRRPHGGGQPLLRELARALRGPTRSAHRARARCRAGGARGTGRRGLGARRLLHSRRCAPGARGTRSVPRVAECGAAALATRGAARMPRHALRHAWRLGPGAAAGAGRRGRDGGPGFRGLRRG
mmetsp:Transcript_140069/g.390432  ORF Transcript_140069/g.390432 Transcript_140069/m.390432 type:complete len:299 (+) Transcript_140069:710-1606(+)